MFSATKRPKGYIVHVEPEGGEQVGKWSGDGNIDDENQITYENIPPGKYVITGRPNPGSETETTNPVTVLENAGTQTLVLFGSGASTTHNNHNIPTLVAGGASLGLKHGQYWRTENEERMSNLYVSILRALQVEQENFSDSTGTLSSPVFTKS